MFTHLPRICIAFLVCSALLNHRTRADEKLRSSELALSTERVIVFKDGYCLVVKQGVARTDESGQVYTEKVPDAAILGSFWAVPEAGGMKSMIAGWIETETTERCHHVDPITRRYVAYDMVGNKPAIYAFDRNLQRITR